MLTGVLTAGTTAQLFTNPYPHTRGIQVKSHPNNTGIIYINHNANQTVQGYPLAPGDEFFVPYQSDYEVSTAYLVYYYADTASQLLHYVLFPN